MAADIKELPPNSSPALFSKRDTSACPGYKVVNKQDTATGFTASLKLAGTPCNAYGNDIDDLKLDVRFDSKNRLQFQIPSSVHALNKGSGVSSSGSSLKFSYFQDAKNGFGFKVSRGTETIFDTTGHPLIFEDQYIEVTSNLPSNANIYGIGETPEWFRRSTTNNTKTLWSRGGSYLLGENIYGSQTIHMELRNGKFHGAYLHNFHGMDIVLDNNAIQYRILGGTADFYFLNGPTALDVIDQYTDLVGRPARIPYWALGFHNCRYGYKDLAEIEEVVANYSKANIPLESQWADVDYKDKFVEYTFDPKLFPLEGVPAKDQKLVLITQPAVHRNSSLGTYARGKALDVFFVSQGWPGYTPFPDWFAPNTNEWYSGEISRFLDKISVDACGSGIPEEVIPPFPWEAGAIPPREPNATNLLQVPPYKINNREVELSSSTIDTTAVHYNGATEYSTHNLYGYMHSKAAYGALLKKRPNKRPILHITIAAMLDHGIFGIPMIGSDICGFSGDTTEELCARWVEVGAFYPFARDHYFVSSLPHELYRWESVAEASRRALGIRYTLLPYIYTANQYAVEKGWPIARPLVFEFSSASQTVGIDTQFLIGDGILISPVLTQGATTVDAFFPAGVWYDWYNYKAIWASNNVVKLDAPLEHVNVHIRGGKIIPAQVPGLTTTESRKGDFSIIVAADVEGSAEGKLYWDDGETLSTAHRWVNFAYHDYNLAISSTSGSYTVPPPLTKIVLLGVGGVTSVKVNGVAVAAKFTTKNNSTVIEGLKINLSASTKVTFV
ncbi:hypothetical protein DL89DRAFT_273529 [Linderina pennispora]|uniref:beta-glucosidase n=1 Tax=Linderina pennispora TaxID=61395 RepID=A0A1Y1WKB8_9FUNG|nr:uncharacterized protein DL89DRAFT_273529 [Linderina pennispora]ORX73656.1 hypothetical protein DL89DRAFT_273529 [Linderina pennispora]